MAHHMADGKAQDGAPDAPSTTSRSTARRLGAALAAVGVLGMVSVVASPAVAQAAGDPSAMRVVPVPAPSDDVRLVVTPPRELSLLDLTPDDITVSDGDGPVPADVSRLRSSDLDVAVAVDLGRSDAEARTVIGAADELVRTLPADAQIALVTTGDNPSVEVPLTSDRRKILAAVYDMQRSSGGDLVEAVGEGADQVADGSGSRSTVIAISPQPVNDGASLKAAARRGERPLAVYLAATGSPSAGLDRSLAATGGLAVTVARPDLLIGATDDISTILGAQYQVEFPAGATDGSAVTVGLARDGIDAAATVALPGSEPVEPDAANASPAPKDDREVALRPSTATDQDQPGSSPALLLGLFTIAIAAVTLATAGGVTLRRRSHRHQELESYAGTAAQTEIVGLAEAIRSAPTSLIDLTETPVLIDLIDLTDPDPVTEPDPDPVTEPDPDPVTEPDPDPVTEPDPDLVIERDIEVGLAGPDPAGAADGSAVIDLTETGPEPQPEVTPTSGPDPVSVSPGPSPLAHLGRSDHPARHPGSGVEGGPGGVTAPALNAPDRPGTAALERRSVATGAPAGAAPLLGRAATAPVRSSPFEPVLLDAAQRADESLARLEALVQSLPEGFPLEGFRLREAVASAHEDGFDIALWDMFRSRCGNAPETTSLAPDVERLTEAIHWGFREVAGDHLSRRVLTELVDRRIPRHGGDPLEIDAPMPGPGRRSSVPITEVGSVSSPALRAALSRQIVESSWPDEGSRSWLGRAAVALSLAHDQAITEPIVGVSCQSPAPTGRAQEARSDVSLRETIDAIAVSATASHRHLESLVELRTGYFQVLSKGRASRAPGVVDLLLANPVVTAQYVADTVELTHQGALNLIRRFEQRGWFDRIGSAGRGGRKYWIASDVLAIFESDFPSNRAFSSADPLDER